jgi:uncharacterized membrane protein YedE/YeeE
MQLSYIHGFEGGLLIGSAAVLLFLFNGRIMGVSGIASKVLTKPTRDSWWRLSFIFGLVLGGWIYRQIFQVVVAIDASWAVLIGAGLLVGFGTVMGSGCTSGHGICGIARFSKRSIIATIVFMAAGILTVWLKRMLGV